jgi:membrane-associated phospholipid phosphatase
MVIKELFKKYGHFLALSVYGLVGILFGLCERFLTPTITVFSRLDPHIPFVKEAVIPYLFWYVYIAGAVAYLGFASKPDYYRLVAFLVIGLTIAIIIYILFPNEQALRPVIAGNDIYSTIMKFIYDFDTPTNVMPSVHVINSIGVHVCLVNCPALSEKKALKAASFICMLLISSSTVLVKQHSIIDVFGGAVVGLALYIAIYKVPTPVFLKRLVEAGEQY